MCLPLLRTCKNVLRNYAVGFGHIFFLKFFSLNEHIIDKIISTDIYICLFSTLSFDLFAFEVVLKTNPEKFL